MPKIYEDALTELFEQVEKLWPRDGVEMLMGKLGLTEKLSDFPTDKHVKTKITSLRRTRKQKASRPACQKLVAGSFLLFQMYIIALHAMI